MRVGDRREYFIERLAVDPEAAIDYLKLTFEEYQTDNDPPFFFKGIRTFIKSQGRASELSKRQYRNSSRRLVEGTICI